MKTTRFVRLLWALAGLSLALGLVREPVLDLFSATRELPRFDGLAGLPWLAGEFDQSIHADEAGLLPAQLKRASSWVDGDAWQGRAETAWFKANRWLVHVAVKGYPQLPGCHLWAEFRDVQGKVIRVRCPLANPREEWDRWEIRRPAGAVAVRIVGEDRASGHAGWIAFSHPFRAWPGAITAAFHGLQLFCTAALALVLVWGPGLLWAPQKLHPAVRAVFLLGTGPLLLAAIGIVTWVVGRFLPPPWIGGGLVAATWLVLGRAGWRRDFDRELSPGLARALGVSLLLVVAVVAKSAYSVGPQGELFRGTVSRNFEMADRIDSRFSFYTVQAATQGWGPAAPATERFFSPWTFFSRGPLAGLASLPIVAATNGRPPAVLPENRWQPFDATGFAAYRVTMIVLASTVIVALFLTLAPIVGEAWALIAAGLLALSPFGAHEILFTWPKWIATTWLLVSFGLAHARRPLGAGLALGLGFLFHPLALLWAPWIGMWTLARVEKRGVAAWIRDGARFSAGAATLVLPWMALGAWMPHLPGSVLAGQAGFVRYWLMADWQPATWTTWWHTRWMNFANTFVPLHGYLAEASYHHPKLSSAYETSGPLVRASQLWWNSLPFAAGLGVWAVGLAALGRALRLSAIRAAALLFVIGPALFIVGYWGMDPLGLLRECGHPLLVAWIALTCVVAAREPGWIRRIVGHRAVPWLQLPETWLMLWLTTFANPAPWAAQFTQLDPVYFVLSTLALLAAARVLARERASPALREPCGTDAIAAPRFSSRNRSRPTAVIVVAVTAAAVLYAAKSHFQSSSPAFATLGATSEGKFQANGHYPGEARPLTAGTKTWGSWCGDDVNTGTLTLGPFAAPATLQLALGGYPASDGNALWLERADTHERHPLKPGGNIGERWRREHFTLPAAWVGQAVVLVARDDARQLGGWFAVSEPLEGGEGGGNAELFATLAAWAINGLLYGALWYAALVWLQRRAWLAPAWIPLAAIALVALAGYGAFWAFFLHPIAGKLYAAGVLLAGATAAWRARNAAPTLPADCWTAPKLVVVIGAFYLALLHLFPTAMEFHTLAAQRFASLPGDNTLPHNTARDLFNGRPLKDPAADWLSSDRPPLQAGWLLLARPATKLLSFDERTTDGTAAVWLQLAWIPACFALLRTLGLPRARAAAWTALLALTGFFVLNSVFTWPKLAAAAFVVATAVLWLPSAAAPLTRRDACLGAGFAGLAWLCHGGIAFSLLALVPWIGWRLTRDRWGPWLAAALVFALLAAPWLLYQKFYDPPGNRLVKWHLGGQIEKDPRGAWETIRDGYRALPGPEIVARRIGNLKYQVSGDWWWWRDFSAAGAPHRRSEEFFHSARALTWWLAGLVALPLALGRTRRPVPWAMHARLAAWIGATTALWCGLMFIPESATIHQGSYATLLVAFALLAAWCDLASPWILGGVALLQAATFATTWVPPAAALQSPANPTAIGIAAVAVVMAVGLVWRESRKGMRG